MKRTLFTTLAIIAIAAQASTSFAQITKVPKDKKHYGILMPPTLRSHPQTTVGDITYVADIAAIDLAMQPGKDTDIAFTIVPSRTENLIYGFSVYGYGEGMPTYGIIANEASGGARGNQTIHLKFKSQYLPLEPGKKVTTYAGYLPIHIYVGSEAKDDNYIKIPVHVTVQPKRA